MGWEKREPKVRESEGVYLWRKGQKLNVECRLAGKIFLDALTWVVGGHPVTHGAR